MKKLAMIVGAGIGMLTVHPSHAAKIYTCVINGDTVYTSKPSGNCRSADLPPIGRYSSARYDAPPKASGRQAAPVRSGTAKNLPAQPGQSRENTAVAKTAAPPAPKNTAIGNGRRAILEQELANERQALADARQALAGARAAKNGTVNQQLISNLQSSVLDRQQNIQALQRELGRM
ncbi:hypothetical protein LVJ83_06395 [Uruburuella testudinis]|uniref:DUF4124 domain-containing protein n=1 Tax=Uruburuella testudinis TaxID=1282863 RepID=A0ABY4DWR7_9NEIS|nr:hypothetical protein [Uruburuella testudinis]UOO83085.1 hypothetical protein LVJ83_06395 [Uruburuella testudinis]